MHVATPMKLKETYKSAPGVYKRFPLLSPLYPQLSSENLFRQTLDVPYFVFFIKDHYINIGHNIIWDMFNYIAGTVHG